MDAKLANEAVDTHETNAMKGTKCHIPQGADIIFQFFILYERKAMDKDKKKNTKV